MKQIIVDLTQNKINLKINQDSEIIGIYVGKNRSSIKITIKLTLSASSLKLQFFIRSILLDESTAEINCIMINPKGIKNTDGHMDIGLILASDKAKANLTPSLEIHENDIKFGHSMAIGKTDPAQVQYLTSRGLTSEEAISIIVKGYIESAINRIKDDTIKTYYLKQLENV